MAFHWVSDSGEGCVWCGTIYRGGVLRVLLTVEHQWGWWADGINNNRSFMFFRDLPTLVWGFEKTLTWDALGRLMQAENW